MHELRVKGEPLIRYLESKSAEEAVAIGLDVGVNHLVRHVVLVIHHLWLLVRVALGAGK
jgi:hypothetical protein